MIRQILAITAGVIYFAGEASTSSNLSPSNAAIQPLVAARLCARLRCISRVSIIDTIDKVHCLKGPNLSPAGDLLLLVVFSVLDIKGYEGVSL